MINSVRIEGYEEAVKMLEHLPDKLQRRVLIRIMRQAAKPVVLTARTNVRSRSNRVAKSIKAWEPRGKSDAVLFVGPKKTSNRDKDPWFAHIIEGGAKGVGRFTVKKNAYKNAGDDRHKIFRFINAKRKGQQRYRKNQTAFPFMQPAVDQNRESVRSIFTKDIDTFIQNEIAKLQ